VFFHRTRVFSFFSSKIGIFLPFLTVIIFPFFVPPRGKNFLEGTVEEISINLLHLRNKFVTKNGRLSVEALALAWLRPWPRALGRALGRDLGCALDRALGRARGARVGRSRACNLYACAG
jgi:hypothetical protein